MPLIDCIDTYFKYVKSRIIQLNSNRIVEGIIEAESWPPKEVNEAAFYMLNLGDTTPKDFGTVSARGVVHLVQWVWVIIGNDLPQTAVMGKNRGSRYRNNYQMKNELLTAQFPGFCSKNSYSAKQQGNTLVSVATPTGDTIWWSAPRFLPSRFEGTSGVLYGAAQIFISEFSDLITS